jgi:hypothetical protein
MARYKVLVLKTSKEFGEVAWESFPGRVDSFKVLDMRKVEVWEQ